MGMNRTMIMRCLEAAEDLVQIHKEFIREKNQLIGMLNALEAQSSAKTKDLVLRQKLKGDVFARAAEIDDKVRLIDSLKLELGL